MVPICFLFVYKISTVMDLYPLCVILPFFTLEVFISQTGAEAKTACNENSYPTSSISLECSTNEWIHVKSVTFGQRKPDQDCLNKTNSCTKTQNSNQNGLVVTCNGKMKCTEYIQVLPSTFSCPNISGIEIEYECIKDSKNVCSEVDIQPEEGIVHLHSPGYPNSESINGSCNCRIHGTLVTVTVLEHRVGHDVVTISTDNTTTRLLGIFNLYNEVITTRTTAANLSYENNGTTASVWIRIIGSGPLHIQCGKGMLNLNASNNVTPFTSSPFTDIISLQSTSDSSSTASRETVYTETNESPIPTSSGTFPTSGISTFTTDMDTAESETSASASANTTTHIPTSSVNDSIIPTSSIQKIPQTETSADPAAPSTPAMTTIQTTLVHFPTPGQDKNPITEVIAVSCAVGGFLFMVIIAVAVVCCRRRQIRRQSNQQMKLYETDSKHGMKKSFTDRNYFQLEPEIINQEVYSEPSVVVRNQNPRAKSLLTDQYAKVVPKSLRVSVQNNSTSSFTVHANEKGAQLKENMNTIKVNLDDNMMNGTSTFGFPNRHPLNIEDTANIEIDRRGSEYPSGFENSDTHYQEKAGNTCHMEDNDSYIDGSASGEVHEEGMVDNFLYHSFIDSEVGTMSEGRRESIESVPVEGLVYQEEGIVVNDLYHNYQSPSSSNNTPEPPNADQRLSSDEESPAETDEMDVMVANDLYHSNKTPTDPLHNRNVSNERTQAAINSDDQDDDKEEGMVMNDLYHSYQTSGSPNEEQTLNDDPLDDDGHVHMIDNDLYYSHDRSNDDETSKVVSAGDYDEILADEICVLSDSTCFDQKARPAAYEEIAELSSVSLV